MIKKNNPLNFTRCVGQRMIFNFKGITRYTRLFFEFPREDCNTKIFNETCNKFKGI